MKLIIVLSISSLLVFLSCDDHKLPFTGKKYCSAGTGVNFKIEISKDCKTKITCAGLSGSYIYYNGLFKDTIDSKGESLIIQKEKCLYKRGEWTDTLQYIVEANW